MTHREECLQLFRLELGASEKEVKTAFRRMALKHHPDKGGKQESFVKIRHAYEYLLRVGTGEKEQLIYDPEVDYSQRAAAFKVHMDFGFHHNHHVNCRCTNTVA